MPTTTNTDVFKTSVQKGGIYLTLLGSITILLGLHAFHEWFEIDILFYRLIGLDTQSMVIKEHPEKNTSSRTVQMRPNKENSFPVTNIRSPVQSLQKMATDPPSFLSFQRSAWKPGKSFQNPRYCSGCSSLPPRVPCCFYPFCSLAWLLMVPHQWDGKLAFTSRRWNSVTAVPASTTDTWTHPWP